MIAVDTNILVYAHRVDSTWHQQARACIDGLVTGSMAWMIPWTCLHEFLAIVTHPAIYKPASTLEEAFLQIGIWHETLNLTIECEGPNHLPVLKEIMARGKVSGSIIYDARVAAVCLEHGIEELWSADRDFSRFPQLKVVNPLVTD